MVLADRVGLVRGIDRLISVLGVSLTLYTFYYAYALPVINTRFANHFLGVGLVIFYLLELKDNLDVPESMNRVRTAKSVVIIGFLVLAIVVSSYVELNFDRLYFDAGLLGLTQTDFLIGVGAIVLAIDSTFRAFGWEITLVVIGSLVYAMVGAWLPGVFQHSGMNWTQVAKHGAIGMNGVYGFILEVGTTWVAIFIMFAGMARSYGVVDFVIDIGQEMKNVLRSGVVHVAVLSSMTMGMITGSAAANTATTGSFTIPMMQRQGVTDEYAAAIESVASSGGQMMPPVMGIAAFLMADIIGIPYLRVLQAGLLPAVLFYVSVALSVHLIILRFDWVAERGGSFDMSVLTNGFYYFIPIFVLIYTLVVLKFTPLSAGLYAGVSLVLTMFLHTVYSSSNTNEVVRSFSWETAGALRQGAVEMAPFVPILASLGLIVTMLSQTGFVQNLSLTIVAVGGQSLLIVLVVAMVTSILFGMGMPTPIAYLLVAIFAAPSMVQVGVQVLSAHMFVFYFAMLSAITPPVAVAIVIGSEIAGANFIKSCKQSLRIALPGFLVPFSFVVNESLIYWEYPLTLMKLLVVFTGLFAVSVAAVGHNGQDKIHLASRVVFISLAAVCLFSPLGWQVIGGLAVIGLLGASILRNGTNPLGMVQSVLRRP